MAVLTPMGLGSQNSQAMSSCRLLLSSWLGERMSLENSPGSRFDVTEITPWPPYLCLASCASSSLPLQHLTPSFA